MERTGRNLDIEVLRALAISFVILLHFAPSFLDHFGLKLAFDRYTALWSGVDLFFCISGYVIARSLMSHSELGAFWIRRIFRLWPAAWAWALITFALAILWNRSGVYGTPARTGADAIAAFLNVANFQHYLCARSQSCGSLSVYWSLSLEEQFYWIFPLLLAILPRRGLIAVLMLIILVQLPLNRPASPAPLAWYIRSDAICFGVLLALLEPAQLAAPRRLTLRLCALVSVVLLGVAAAPEWIARVSTGLIAILSAGLLYIARFNANVLVPKDLLGRAVVLWIGSRSYALYLVHEVASRMVAEFHHRVHFSLWLSAALTLLLTGVCAEVTFRWVETPLRDIGRRITSVRVSHPKAPRSIPA